MEISAKAFWITIAALILYAVLLLYFPVVWVFISAEAGACFFLYIAFDAFKSGSIRIRAGFHISGYEFRRNPVAFLFYTVLCLSCGLCCFIGPIYMLLHLVK